MYPLLTILMNDILGEYTTHNKARWTLFSLSDCTMEELQWIRTSPINKRLTTIRYASTGVNATNMRDQSSHLVIIHLEGQTTLQIRLKWHRTKCSFHAIFIMLKLLFSIRSQHYSSSLSGGNPHGKSILCRNAEKVHGGACEVGHGTHGELEVMSHRCLWISSADSAVMTYRMMQTHFEAPKESDLQDEADNESTKTMTKTLSERQWPPIFKDNVTSAFCGASGWRCDTRRHLHEFVALTCMKL